MKKTNVYFFRTVSCSLKSLITGSFLLVFMAFANHGSAQISAPTPESVLPPLKPKIECIELAKAAAEELLVILKQNPNDDARRRQYNAYQFVILQSDEPTFEMAQILAMLWPEMHPAADGTATHAAGFYAKSWSSEYTSIVNKFKK